MVESRDFSLRAARTTEDEIGTLADGFNGMLSEIGRRAEILEESNRTLGARDRRAPRAPRRRFAGQSERRNRTLKWSGQQRRGVDRCGRPRPLGRGGAVLVGVYRADARAIPGPGLAPRLRAAGNTRRRSTRSWETRARPIPAPFNLELHLWHAATHRHRHVSVRAVPLLGEGGLPGEWIGTISDIDDQRRAEQDLRELNTELESRVANRTAELESANKEPSESFSYSVSHDLRSPVRAVAGFERLLWEDHSEQLDVEARRKLGFLQGEAERMGVLIDDLLAFSRLGRQAMQRGPLDMQKMAHDVYERLLAQHSGAPVQFNLGTSCRRRSGRPRADGAGVGELPVQRAEVFRQARTSGGRGGRAISDDQGAYLFRAR